jgi:hypothetical protein
LFHHLLKVEDLDDEEECAEQVEAERNARDYERVVGLEFTVVGDARAAVHRYGYDLRDTRGQQGPNQHGGYAELVLGEVDANAERANC